MSSAYDAAGNIWWKADGDDEVYVQYDGRNRVARVYERTAGVWGQPTPYAHDAKGNITDNGRRTFTYDAADQMTRVNSSTAPDATYTYDGNLKHVKSVESGKTIYSVYAQSGALLHRDDKAKNEATDYVSAGGEAVARVTKKSSGARDVLFVHTDHLGWRSVSQ